MSNFMLWWFVVPFILVYVTGYVLYTYDKKQFIELYTHNGKLVFAGVVSIIPVFSYLFVFIHLFVLLAYKVVDFLEQEIIYEEDENDY